MDSFALCVAVLLLVGHAISLDLPHNFWEPGREVVYMYQTDVQIWTMLPVKRASMWQMRAKLIVQGEGDRATLQLQDIETGVYNGLKDDGLSSDMTWGPAPEQAQQLSNPFRLHYEHDRPGEAMGMMMTTGEDLWVTNMKRGLASLLQLNLPKMNKKTTVIMEPGLHGTCAASYVVQKMNDADFKVRKHIDHSSCLQLPLKTRDYDKELHCTKDTQPDLTSDSTITYELGSHPFIRSIEAEGNINMQVLRANTEYHRIVTLQNLTLLGEHEITERINIMSGGEKTSLRFEHSAKDITQGRATESQEQLLALGKMLLEQLGSKLEQDHLEVKPGSLDKDYASILLYLLPLMDQPTLRKLYLTLEGSHGHHYKLVRKLYLELLPQIGSHDAALIVRDLVVSRTVQNSTAVRLVYTLPFFIQDAAPELLPEFEVLLDDVSLNPLVHNTAILSFSTLVNKLCKGLCETEIVEKYIQKYMEHITGGDDNYGEQMLYVQGLTNFKHYKVLEYLTPLISNPGLNRHLRYQAMWATKSVGTCCVQEKYELYMPILKNNTESLELRAAALYLLMMSEPTLGQFYDLLQIMKSEKDPHLQNYWYTSLKSVAYSRHPCYSEVSEIARRIIRIVDEPDIGWWPSSAYQLDYVNQEYNFGARMYACILANPSTGLPNILYFSHDAYAGHHEFFDYALLLRLEGLNDHHRRSILQNAPKNLGKLTEILESLKLPRMTSDPFLLEISILYQENIVQTFYMNATNYQEVMKDIRSLSRGLNEGKDMNLSLLDITMYSNQGHLFTTDIGTPVMAEIALSTTTAGHSLLNATEHHIEHNKIDFRFLMSGQTLLTAYNPLLDLWHSAQKWNSIQAKLPLSFLQASSEDGTEHTWTFQQMPGVEVGFVWHVQSTTSISGMNAEDKIKSHCPSCHKEVVVHGGDELPEQQTLIRLEAPNIGGLEVSLPQCEHVKDQELVLTSLLDEVDEYVNAESIPSAALPLMLMQVADTLFLAAPPGSCGIAVRLVPPVQPSQVELKLKITAEKTHKDVVEEYKYNVQVELGHKEQESAVATKWIELDLTRESERTKESVNLEVKLPGNNKVCMVAETVKPDVVLKPVLFSEKYDGMKFYFGLTWGTMDQCLRNKDADGIEVAILAGLSEKQLMLLKERNVGPYAECWQDMGGKPGKDVPPTAACTQVYKEQTTLRHYHIIVSYKNWDRFRRDILSIFNQLEDWSVKLVEDREDVSSKPVPLYLKFMLVPLMEVPWILYELGEPEPANYSATGNIEMSLELPAEGNGVLATKEYEVTLDDDVMESIEPWVINTQKLWKQQLATNLDIHGTCVINSNGVRTIDSANHTNELSTCYTLAIADCMQYEESRFAVFVKKVDEANAKLAVKIYLFNEEIEILPGEDKPMVQVNGTAVDITPEVSYPEDASSAFHITMSENVPHFLGVTSLPSIDFTLTYTGKSMMVATSGIFRGTLCGLCGNFDGNAIDDDTHQYLLECA